MTEPIPGGAGRRGPAVAAPAPPAGQAGPATRDEGRVPPNLDLCRACSWFIWPGQATCPFCGTDVAAAAAAFAAEQRRQMALVDEVQRLVDKIRAKGAPESAAITAGRSPAGGTEPARGGAAGREA